MARIEVEMKTLKLIAALGLVAAVAACGNSPSIKSRNAPFETISAVPAAQLAAVEQAEVASTIPLRVTQINVVVPQDLSVTEANKYYPRADIVWRGDPIGDRHQQVKTIFETAFLAGTQGLSGPTDVTLDVRVKRFHSLTEKARYTIGGVHNMEFDLIVRRASTGEPLAPARMVVADLPALGGTAAVEADRMGQTQKVRVTGFLMQVIQQELSRYVAS